MVECLRVVLQTPHVWLFNRLLRLRVDLAAALGFGRPFGSEMGA